MRLLYKSIYNKPPFQIVIESNHLSITCPFIVELYYYIVYLYLEINTAIFTLFINVKRTIIIVSAHDTR